MSHTAVVGSGYVSIENGRHGVFTADSPNAVLDWVRNNAFSGRVVFQPGVYLFSSSATLPNANLEIVLERGSTLVPSHSGAIGLFEMTGDNAAITGGGKVSIPNWVNN
ncbi:MAG: hypothetical protein IPK26_26300, partial [Planctomycetes bacterium]|nr:hypothetical protein [Planctomycetota bacterium]